MNKYLDAIKRREATKASKAQNLPEVPKSTAEGIFSTFGTSGLEVETNFIFGTSPETSQNNEVFPKTRGDKSAKITCPPMPAGVRLVYWDPKDAPVAIDVFSVVTDVQRFIDSELESLDHRLNNPWCVRGGWTVPQLIDRLSQVGLVVEVDVGIFRKK